MSCGIQQYVSLRYDIICVDRGVGNSFDYKHCFGYTRGRPHRTCIHGADRTGDGACIATGIPFGTPLPVFPHGLDYAGNNHYESAIHRIALDRKPSPPWSLTLGIMIRSSPLRTYVTTGVWHSPLPPAPGRTSSSRTINVR